MSTSYDTVLADLRRAYDGMVEERERREVPPWKQAERTRFLELLQAEGKRELLEVGAGTGVHGRFFVDAGLDVVCTDLSGAMVEACRAKGLTAYRQDFLSLDLDRSFDAVFAMNCLLHVPAAELQSVLHRIRSVMRPDGLLYLGQYGGIELAGTLEDDVYEPKRFFSWLTDDALRAEAEELFDILDFRTVDIGSEDGVHFQSLVLGKPGDTAPP